MDPLETVGWLDEDKDPVDGRQKVFEKCIDLNENSQNIRNCTQLVFKDIFTEYKLKENLEDIEKICAQNDGCNYIVYGGERLELEKNDWFYCDEKCAHFSENKEETNTKLTEESEYKSEQPINAHNSDENNSEYIKSEDDLIDQYDEETILLQIPQDDTEVGVVMSKFKDINRAADTIVILRDKGKVITGICGGQSYIRRLKTSENGDHSPDTGFNKWICGMCGIKFDAQIPYEDYKGNVICRNCWEKLTDSEK